MGESVKASKFAVARKNVIRFFKEIRMELKKVVWPTKEQLIKSTVTVLFACLFVGALIWIVDFGLTKVVELTLAR